MPVSISSGSNYSKVLYYRPSWVADCPAYEKPPAAKGADTKAAPTARCGFAAYAGTGDTRKRDGESTEKTMAVVRDAFLREVSNSWIETGQVTQEMLNDLGIGINITEPMILLGARINLNTVPDSGSHNAAIHESFKRYLPIDCTAIHWPMRLNTVLWVLQARCSGGVQLSGLRLMLARLKMDCARKLGVDVSFTAFQRPINFLELQTASQNLLEQMGAAQNSGAVAKSDIVSEADGADPCEHSGITRAGGDSISIQALEYMESLLLQGHKKEFIGELKKHWYSVEKTENMNNIFMMEQYFSISSVLLRCLTRIAAANSIDGKTLYELRPKKFLELSSWDEAFEHVMRTAENLMALCERHKESYEVHLLKYVRHYVDEHVYDRVSLSDIAEYTKYNPAYISRIFKKHNGVTLSVYINHVRMNKAKEMLAKSSLSVYEIANRAGFESPQYFATVFKKSTGFSPKQYRLASGNI